MSFIGSVVDPVLLMIPVLVLTILLGAATEVDGMAAAADLPLAVLPLPPLFFDGPPFPCPLPILNPPWLPFPAALEIRKQHERHKLGLGIYIWPWKICSKKGYYLVVRCSRRRQQYRHLLGIVIFF